MAESIRTKTTDDGQPVAPSEWACLALATVAALLLGVLNLGLPSLWHDELVHIFVARSIAEHAWPTLPGGALYPSSLFYNVGLGLVVKLFGDGAFAVRLPSVLVSGINVVLLHFIARALFGRSVAVLTVFAFALSPWNVAWSRQARLYELQAMAYLLFTGCAWRAFEEENKGRAARFVVAAVVAYLIGIFTSFHSILFLGPVGAYAILQWIASPPRRKKSVIAIGLCLVTGLLTLAALYFNPNTADQSAVFSTGLGGTLPDPQRLIRWAYLRWLYENLSVGVLLTMFIGSALALYQEKRQGVYAVLAFWVPLLILTFLIGYRRPRFLFLAFPFYVCLSSYGIVQLVLFTRHFKRSALHAIVALLIALFGMRLTLTAVKLTQDSIALAQGNDITLARRHPQWQKPCQYVREHRMDEAVLTTTFLPVMYYVGHVDTWFPNRYQWWESQESGIEGLASLEKLKDFVAKNPKGYYIAEFDRFEKSRHHGALIDTLGKEVTWVQENMRRIDEASSRDVTVYVWGL